MLSTYKTLLNLSMVVEQTESSSQNKLLMLNNINIHCNSEVSFALHIKVKQYFL